MKLHIWEKSFGKVPDIFLYSYKDLQGTVVNQAFHSLTGVPPKIMYSVPLICASEVFAFAFHKQIHGDNIILYKWRTTETIQIILF